MRPLVKAMYALGITAVVILAIGLGEFLYFEPLGETTGTTARVQGVYAYDPATGSISGGDSSRFDRTQPFAAVVDWESLPAEMVVSGRWYNGFGVQVGGVGPGLAGGLSTSRVVQVEVPHGLTTNIPGEYLFVVERVSRGQPVEVLARRLVLVTRG